MKSARVNGTAIAIALLSTCCLEAAWGQATTDAVIPNDASNYLGDRIRFAVKVDVTKRGDTANNKICIPPLTRMSVIGKDGTNLVVKIADKTKDCSGTEIDTGDAYLVSTDTLASGGLARTGATYGALVVPFKYHLTGNKDFTGSSTLGAYLGYRFETANAIGYTLTPIAFMGASTISTTTTDASGQTKDQNLSGFAYGAGLVGTFKGGFQAGVVMGWDRVSKTAGYQYNGKPWIALELGFTFLQ